MNFKQNFFEIFQLPVSFVIDEAELADRYRSLQLKMHPDNFASASAQEKRLSAQWTAQINEAFDTLKKSLSRAIYLLKLQDVTIEHNPNLDPIFLMEQIELREELEEIEVAESALELLDTYKLKVKIVMAEFENVFANSIDADLKQAEQAVYKLQFINKLFLAADQLEEKLLDY